jgi:GNAT superfamily N-acetyltransferase
MCDARRVDFVVRRASASDAGPIVALLARALDADPFVRWLARGKPRAMRRYFALMLERIALPKGVVYVASRGGAPVSAALWAPPSSFELTTTESLFLLPTMVAVIGPFRFGRVARALDQIERARPPEPRWLLTLLGTLPEERRRGAGSAVLAPVLARCDDEDTMVVCETCEEQNLAFYGRLGFEVTAQRHLADGGPLSWTLQRIPGAALVSSARRP